MSHSANRANVLRSLPVIAGALLFLVVLRYVPEMIDALSSYIVNSDPEEKFSEYGWKLYYIIVPLCIVGLSRPKKNWPVILAILLAPVILAFSYWLWEILGWVVIGVYFYVIAILMLAFDASLLLVFTAGIAAVGYAVLRILALFGNEHLLGIADVGFIGLLGGYMLVVGIVDVFRLEDGDGKAYFGTSNATMLYITVLAVALMIMSGSGNWKNIFTFGNKTDTALVTPSPAPAPAQDAKTNKQAQKTDNKKSQSKPAQQPTTKTANTAKNSVPATGKQVNNTATTQKTAVNKQAKATEKKAKPATATKLEASPATKPAPKLSVYEQHIDAANSGDAAACYVVAQCYMNGDGVGKDKSKAFQYMKKAATGGYSPAYIEVAKMYHGGRGVTKDRDEAERWYNKAAASGNAEAKRILQNM